MSGKYKCGVYCLWHKIKSKAELSLILQEMKHFISFIFCFAWLSLNAQYQISNGVGLPTNDTIRALIVFAEVDFSNGTCPRGLPSNIVDYWGVDENGKTKLPANAANFLDYQIEPGKNLQGYITDYYYQASFGQYILLGDYLPFVVSVPCSEIRTGMNLNPILQILDQHKEELKTQNGLSLKDFDIWTEGSPGLPKLKQPDGKIDLLYIIWKNNRFLISNNTLGNSGYGVNQVSGIPFREFKGLNNVASFNAATADVKSYTITIAEHLHAIFGGNHWHSCGGAGNHTFLAMPKTYGTTAQFSATMQSVCGWDRWMMNWKHPQKNHLIGALNQNFVEVNTETLTANNTESSGIYYLRDHVSTGDAIRIKLPHIDWQKEGDVKNQYLWLEFRSLTTTFDQYLNPDLTCMDSNNGKFPKGVPGIYAYIQVGKDIKQGTGDIYTSRNAHPNGLGSYLHPFSAEGNFDFYYDYEKLLPGKPIECSWGNRSIPICKKRSKPNPFTGFSDLHSNIDFNKDGFLFSGDTTQAGLSEVVRDSAIFNYHANGDYEDAFSLKNGYKKISISTNPAPVPLYTLTTNYDLKQTFYKKGMPQSSYENRTIHLNGLKIEVLEEDVQLPDGHTAVKLHIMWDHYLVEQNVRWCGNIELHPHIYNPDKPSLDVAKSKKVLLARSQTPTLPYNLGKNKNDEFLMSETTTFTANSGSVIRLQKRAKLILSDDSVLKIEDNVGFILNKKSKIVIKDDAKLIVDSQILTTLQKNIQNKNKEGVILK